MEYLYVGDIVNTHGIKGEIRILSDADYKDCIFKKGVHLYIGKKKEMETIATYRVHKNYDMVTFEGLEDINDVIIYKGEKVYVLREEIELPGFLKEDLIDMDVVSTVNRGKVKSLLKSKAHDILVIMDGEKKYLVPYVDEFIEKIDFDTHTIYIKEMKGLFDEN